MAEDYGLLSGLAKGINTGLDAYEKGQDRQLRIKQYNDDLEVKKLLRKQQEQKLNMDATTSGLVTDPSSDTGFSLSPDAAMEKKNKGFLLGAQTQKALAEAQKALREAHNPPKADPNDYMNQKPNNDMFAAGNYAKRMEQAENVFSGLTDKGFKYGNKEAILSSDYVPDVFKPENLKSQNQAEKNFINALLRKESGASISEAEFDNAAKQYFPRPGDSPEILQQKKDNRQQSMLAFKAQAGKAYGLIPTAGSGLLQSKESSSGTPRAGEIMDGFRFKGGDPADPKNWEKQ